MIPKSPIERTCHASGEGPVYCKEASTFMRNNTRSLGLNAHITRRDFIGATLVGSGAILLGAPAPARAQGLTSQWNGYAGIGDYARSNGNIASVVNAAHGVRDGIYEKRIDTAPVVDELYDLVIVGGGFAGFIAAYEFPAATPRSCDTSSKRCCRTPLRVRDRLPTSSSHQSTSARSTVRSTRGFA
jgi:hypothetical protein